MREIDRDRLRMPYQLPVEPVPDDRRLNVHLGFGIDSLIELADTFSDGLDPAVGGIGWWKHYHRLGRQDRIFISDHLLACARSVSQNLSESYAYRLEFDHAVEDFRLWLERGLKGGQPFIPPPLDLYEDLSYVRVNSSLAGVFRALASALDCVAACVVGVAGLPTALVKTDLAEARSSLQKESKRNPRLQRLLDNLNRAEGVAGPPGWITWLLDMRNMLVHRGRRIFHYRVDQGTAGDVNSFCLVLPRSPELTEVQGWVYATGTGGSFFEEPADSFLTGLSESTCKYINETGRLLLDLWQERKTDPDLIEQPGKQWHQAIGLINPNPVFNGYAVQSAGNAGPVREVAVADDVLRRMQAAGITVRDVGQVRPSPDVWF